MIYNVTSKIMPNAKLPLEYVKNTFDKRNKIAKQKSIEFYKNITNECKDGVYSISRIRKCIDNLFAPNKITLSRAKKESNLVAQLLISYLSIKKNKFYNMMGLLFSYHLKRTKLKLKINTLYSTKSDI